MVDSNWQIRTIDDLKAKSASAIAIGPFGSRMKSDSYVELGVPVIRGNNISDTRELVGEMVYITNEKADELRSSNVYPDDIYFPHRGAIGRVGIVLRGATERYVLSSSLMKLTCDLNQVTPLFLFYFFRSEQGRHALLENASTVGTPGIGQPLSTLKSILVPIPPHREQRAIAHVLGTLDDKIELNRRMSATLESMAQALFKSWFVDFDGHANLIASELGPIPRGWEVVELGDFISLDKGLSYKGKFLDGNGLPMVNLGCFLGEGRTDWKNLKMYSGEYRGRHLVAPGDIVVANTDITQKRLVIGSPAQVPDNAGISKFLFSHHTYAIRFHDLDTPHHKNFVYHTLLLPQFRARAEGFATGTTVLALPTNAITDLKVVLPPERELMKFSETTGRMRDRVGMNLKESNVLTETRDTLLPRLISGELRLRGESVDATAPT